MWAGRESSDPKYAAPRLQVSERSTEKGQRVETRRPDIPADEI